MTKLWSRGTAVALALFAGAQTAEPASDAGGLVGFVQDGSGVPVSGAVISVFGRGLSGGGLVTLSDSTGRFMLNSVPAGSYTVRTLAAKHRSANTRRVVILPNQDATFTISLAAEAEARAEARAAEAEPSDPESAARELRWLLRHKRRSSLEERGQGPQQRVDASYAMPDHSGLLAALAGDLAASVEVLTTPDAVPGFDTDADSLGNLGMVRLQGRIADSVHWALGGLVAERDGTAWRVAGDFVFTPFGGHEIQASTGYGSVAPRTAPFAGTGPDARWQDRGVGAIELKDRWQIGEQVAATLGTRYTYVGFLSAANHLDPSATIELRRDDEAFLRASVSRRTLVPGGDVLTLSGISSTSSVALAVLEKGLRPERVMRYELAFGQALGPVSVEARTFYEGMRDQLVQRFEPEGGVVHVSNGEGFSARGMAVAVSRRFGDAVHGEVSYTFGRGRRPRSAALADGPWRETDFHDLAARLETVIEGTDTRVIAFWRLNHLVPEAVGVGNPTATRFDVQLSQGLPFLHSVVRADWDVLLGVKNVYYGEGEAGVLDEIAVVNPPKRVVGGISVRF